MGRRFCRSGEKRFLHSRLFVWQHLCRGHHPLQDVMALGSEPPHRNALAGSVVDSGDVGAFGNSMRSSKKRERCCQDQQKARDHGARELVRTTVT